MNRGNIFKVALAIGLILSISVCCVQAAQQNKLSQKLVRLHVLANSDSQEDQELKLKVRDAVLEVGVDKRPEPEDLERVQQAAVQCLRQNGYDYDAKVTYEKMYFETRDYDGFSLPAGYYSAIRVAIGEAKGKNWWCVVYPSLCTGFAEATAEGELTDEEVSYIKKDGKKYVVKFKLQEMISQWSRDIF